MKYVLAAVLTAWLLTSSFAFAGPHPASRVVNVLDAGAVGDGKAKDTTVVQNAIDSVSAAGGGTVVFPPGNFLIGGIALKSHVTLDVHAGATLLGSPNLADYPLQKSPMADPRSKFEYPHYALIHAQDVEDVSIIGEGIIDGQGKAPEFNEWRKYHGEEKARRITLRPYLLAFVHCTNVKVEDVMLRDSGYWIEDYLDCDGVLIRGIKVLGHANGNNDGIDIDGSRNVRIADCNIDTGDDAVCLKANYSDCANIAITNCIVKSGCNGIKLGTASVAAFRNIAISNCIVHDTELSGVALEVVDGGSLDGVIVTGLAMYNVGTPIFLRLGDRGARPIPGSPAEIGTFRNVTISDIVATTRKPDEKAEFKLTPLAASITGLPGHPLENISVSNLRITCRTGCPAENVVEPSAVPEAEKGYPEFGQFGPLPAYGLYCRHVTNLTLRNIDVSYDLTDPRSALVCDDINQLSIDALRAHSEGEHPVVVLKSVKDGTIANSRNVSRAKTFVSVLGESSRINIFQNDLGGNDAVKAEAKVSAEIMKQQNRTE